jgi:ferredoxin
MTARYFDVAIEVAGRVEHVVAGSDEFVLDAARRRGLDLPSLCEQGWCTRCAVRVLAGDVDQSAALRYFEADRQAGFALICSARPRSDLRLRAGGHEELRAHRLRSRLPVPRG